MEPKKPKTKKPQKGLTIIKEINGVRLELKGPGFEKEDDEAINRAIEASHRIDKKIEEAIKRNSLMARKINQDGIKIVDPQTKEGKNILFSTKSEENLIDSNKKIKGYKPVDIIDQKFFDE